MFSLSLIFCLSSTHAVHAFACSELRADVPTGATPAKREIDVPSRLVRARAIDELRAEYARLKAAGGAEAAAVDAMSEDDWYESIVAVTGQHVLMQPQPQPQPKSASESAVGAAVRPPALRVPSQAIAESSTAALEFAALPPATPVAAPAPAPHAAVAVATASSENVAPNTAPIAMPSAAAAVAKSEVVTAAVVTKADKADKAAVERPASAANKTRSLRAPKAAMPLGEIGK